MKKENKKSKQKNKNKLSNYVIEKFWEYLHLKSKKTKEKIAMEVLPTPPPDERPITNATMNSRGEYVMDKIKKRGQPYQRPPSRNGY